MSEIISDFKDSVKIITPEDGYHYFFAYYDMRATGDGINGRHLCHRVKFMDRQPEADDICELGYLDGGKFFRIAETTAWNFQQGAMLQYHPTKEDTVYYNVCEGGKFSTVTHNFKSGEKKYTDRATACVSPDGKWGLAVNFGRIFAFRPGYGYAGFVDENESVNAPTDDGVFLTDMESGKSKLLVSYADMLGESGFTEKQKILVNHITFNTASDKYVMLVRNFFDGENIWKTSLMLGDLNGGFKTVLKRTTVSHYFWISRDELLVFCEVPDGKMMLYVINVESGEYRSYDSYFFDGTTKGDIHCSLSPDGESIIGDGYPIDGQYRDILSIKVRTGESKSILRAKTVVPENGDIRCDLHARFVFDGKFVSFDTTQNGRREIALFPTEKIRF